MLVRILGPIVVSPSRLIFIRKLEELTWLFWFFVCLFFFPNPIWFVKFYYIIEVAIELNESDMKKISFQQKRLQIAKRKFNVLANSVPRDQLVIS